MEQARGEGRRGERARGGVKKKDFRERGDGPRRRADCLSALGAPAARPPPQSEIHTKWRLGLEEPRG